MIAPGTALREGIESILHARTGGLIVIGEPEDLSFLNSGGIKLDIDYTPAFLYQVAKMDGAIILNANATKITMANVQLMPDPTILSHETGTRHRTAERVSKQTDALVIAISQRREVVSVYVDGVKYILEDIPVVLAKANQALATLDKYRTRLDQVSTRLTALEFEGGDDAARRAHGAAALRAGDADGGRDRALHRRAGQRGPADRDAAGGDDGRRRRREGGARARLPVELLRRGVRRGARGDRAARPPGPARLRPAGRAARLRPQAEHPRLPGLAARLPRPGAHSQAAQAGGRSRSSTSSAGWTSCWPPPTPSSRRSRASGRSGRRTSARACAGCRRSTSWTATYRLESRPTRRSPQRKEDTIPDKQPKKQRSWRSSRSPARSSTSSSSSETTSSIPTTARGRCSRRRRWRSSANGASTSRSRSCTTT